VCPEMRLWREGAQEPLYDRLDQTSVPKHPD
jgi:hypothetical protein